MPWRGSFNPEAFSVAKVNRELARKFRTVRKKTVRSAVPQPGTAKDAMPKPEELLEAIAALLLAHAFPQKERMRIKSNETVPLELSERERALILTECFADESLTNRLRVVPKKGQRPVFRFTLDDMDELAGCVAFEANHAKNKKLQKEWAQLCERIQAILDGYTDE